MHACARTQFCGAKSTWTCLTQTLQPATRRIREPETKSYEVDFRVVGHASPREILALWPADKDEALARTLIIALDGALEEAVEHGFITPDFDHSQYDVPSVSIHEQNRHSGGFYPIVRTLADLLIRLADNDQHAARQLTDPLSNAEHLLPRRIRLLHMLTNPAAYSPGEAASALAMLDPESFWSPTFQREVMRLITLRWNDFSEFDRDELVERIVARPPADMVRSRWQ